MPNSRNAQATADSTSYFRPPSSGRRLFTGYAIIAYSGTLSSSKPMNNDAKCVAQASVRPPSADRHSSRYISSFSPLKPSRRSEEHTSELQSLMRISYAVFCLKKKIEKLNIENNTHNVTHISTCCHTKKNVYHTPTILIL